MRVFDGLANFSFNTSETKRDVSNKYGIYELPHELPNDLRLRILGNYEISGISKFHGIIA